MPKATQKTKGVSPSISGAQQHHQIVPVADQAWDLTLPKVSGDGGVCHSSIESLLGNFTVGPFGPNTLSVNTSETQPIVQDQQQQQLVGSGVLHPRGSQATSIPAIHPTQQYGGIQLQGTGEGHGGRASNQTDEGFSDHQHTGRTTPVLHDGEPSGSITSRQFIRAVPISRLQNLQKLQEKDQRGQSTETNKQAEGGYGGNGMANSHSAPVTYAASSSYPNLRAYRPPQLSSHQIIKSWSQPHICQSCVNLRRGYIKKLHLLLR